MYHSKWFFDLLSHQLMGALKSDFGTIKKECIYRRKYVTLKEIKIDVFEYV